MRTKRKHTTTVELTDAQARLLLSLLEQVLPQPAWARPAFMAKYKSKQLVSFKRIAETLRTLGYR